MKVTLRALVQKTTLVSTAFILAVSTLTAVAPFILSQKAYAAPYGDVVVRQAATQGWTQTGVQTSGATSFVTDTSAPYGVGALEMKTVNDNNSKVQRVKSISPNVQLSDITELSYWTKQVSAGKPTDTASIQLTVNGLTGTSASTTLVFEPYWNVAGHVGTSQNLPSGVWQQWNAKDGVFWSTKTYASAGLTNGAGGPPFYTLQQVIDNNPNAKVTSLVLNLGTYNPANTSYVDGVNFNGVVYDFEPAPYVPTTPPVRPSLSGTVIYDSIPTTLPSNSPSLGYQATRTSAFGDKVTFAGTDRHLVQAAVTLSSWACETGSGATCVTTPGATFSHPITLNIYNVAGDGTVGSLIGSKTQTFQIPYRPSADPTCSTPTQWRDTNGVCSNGINHVIVFDASGITVPNTVIYSVAYNTQSYGVSPIGATGPYNSLNVSLSTGAAAVGTNVDTDETFWDSTYLSRPAGLTVDSGWGADGNPAVAFTAITPDTVKPVVTLENPTVSTFDSTDTDLVIKATDNIGLDKVVANIYQGGTLLKSTQSSAGGATEFTHTVDLANLPGIGLLPVGSYSVRYNATDLAGNLSQTKTFSFTIVDKVKPLTTLVTPTTNGPFGDTTVAIQVDATDDRGLNKIVANIYKDGVLFKSTQTAVGGATSGTHSASVVLPEGAYTIRYNASDLAGNISQTKTFDITIDTTAPAVTLDALTTTSTTPTITGTVDDPTAVVTVTVDGTSYTATNNGDGTWEYTFTSPLTVGTYDLDVYATDAAGNETSPHALGTLTISQAPVTPPAGTTDDDEEDTEEVATVAVVTPLITSPTGTPAILGTNTNEGADADNGVADVEGTSNEKTAAQAVDSDANQGKLWGLAWYWWLLILAGIATILWWIIAAIRRRQNDDA